MIVWKRNNYWPGLPTFEDKYYRDPEPQEYILDSSITVDDVEFAAALTAQMKAMF
jgi:hypothetical protein